MDADPEMADPLDTALPIVAAQVVWAARHEMARTVEDVLVAPDPRPVPQCASGDSDGAGSRAIARGRIGTR